MGTVMLKNEHTLDQEISLIIQDILTLPVNEVADSYVSVLIRTEEDWIKDDHFIGDEMAKTLRTSVIVDKINNTLLDETPFVQTTGVKISPFLAAWINTLAGNAKSYMTLVGVFSYYFHQFNPKDEWVTLAWVTDRIGRGRKIPDMPNLFKYTKALLLPPLAVVADNSLANQRTVFDTISAEDFYSYDKAQSSK